MNIDGFLICFLIWDTESSKTVTEGKTDSYKSVTILATAVE